MLCVVNELAHAKEPQIVQCSAEVHLVSCSRHEVPIIALKEHNRAIYSQ